MEVFLLAAQEGQHFLAEGTDPWLTVKLLLVVWASCTCTDRQCEYMFRTKNIFGSCCDDQAVMEKAALTTSATLDLTKGWSASASVRNFKENRTYLETIN